MKTKSIRIPDGLIRSVKFIESREKIEEAAAIRKLIRVGFETYVARMYEQGTLTLREAAKQLDLSVPETLELFLELGVRGNLEAVDVIYSLEKMEKILGNR